MTRPIAHLPIAEQEKILATRAYKSQWALNKNGSGTASRGYTNLKDKTDEERALHRQSQIQKHNFETYWSNPEKGRERAQAYRQTPKGGVNHKAGFKRWVEKNPERHEILVKKGRDKRAKKIQGLRAIVESGERKLTLEERMFLGALKLRSIRYCYKHNKSINYRLRNSLRSSLRRCIKKGSSKLESSIASVGCSVEFLRNYLEERFTVGMSWDNYGLRGWEIDHIIPLSSFDLSDPNQFAAACHYSNLIPMWSALNRSKGDKMTVDGEVVRGRDLRKKNLSFA
jgi:hypothetical protein